MNTNYCARARLQVAAELSALIEQELTPQLGQDAARFWVGFATLLDRLIALRCE